MRKIFLISFVFFTFISSGQTGSEIFLFDLKITKEQVIISGGKNITNHKGYDNQPFFHPTLQVIYYSSFNDSSRSDIKYYDYEKNQTKNLTLTQDREYSPTVTPDGKFISCILQRDNGAQDLIKYPINGGEPQVLINDLTIGYHAWAGEDKLILFVLDDSVSNSLHYYSIRTKTDTVLAKNIGRSLHKIPGENAMSFVQKIPDKTSVIKEFDLNSGSISNIISALPEQDHLTWLGSSMLLMSDGNKLFVYRIGSAATWQPIIIEGDTTMLKGVTRLATNKANTKLAVVVSE